MSLATIPLERESRQLSVSERKPTLAGVVSLLDMLRFYADFFVNALFELTSMADGWKANDGMIPHPGAVAGKLSALQLQCMEHGLEESGKKCARIIEKAHNKPGLRFKDVVNDLNQLRELLESELQSRVFVCLTPAESRLYDKPETEWQSIIARFPRVRHDVDECSKCFALGRYAAALFHAMLIAEFGIIQVAKLFPPDPGKKVNDKPGWADLERLRQINEKQVKDRTPLELQHKDFLKSLMPLALAMKDSWRHKISHVDNKLEWMDTDFSPEVAGEIISATRGFMRRLAQDLPK